MTLVRTITPLPDESLAGMVARAAGANVYPRAHDVLIQAGLEQFRPETIPIRDPMVAHDLAAVLGTTAEILAPHFHRSVDNRTEDFFGVKLRSHLRETRMRRVSPTALKDKPYIRAIWSIRPLTFDPKTMEYLIQECPVCARPLGFSKTWGVEFCEHCIENDEYGLPKSAVDLRDFPQPKVEVDDLNALQFVTSLIDPALKGRNRISLHDDLASLPLGEMFEMVLSLSSAIVSNELRVQPRRRGMTRFGADVVSPHHLAKAGRALLNWPTGFLELCMEASQNSPQREAKWGLRKELGAIGRIAQDEYLGPTSRNVVRKQYDYFFGETRSKTNEVRKGGHRDRTQWMSMIDVKNHLIDHQAVANRLFQDHRIRTIRQTDAPKSPKLVDTKQATAAIGQYLELIDDVSGAARLGIPLHAIQELVERGYLQRDIGIASSLSGKGANLSEREVDRVIVGLKRAMSTREGEGFVPINQAMARFPAGWRPWSTLIEAMIWRRVEIKRLSVTTKGFLTGLAVRGIEDCSDALLESLYQHKTPSDEAVPCTSALLMLGMSSSFPLIKRCAEKGFLRRDHSGRYLVEDILTFSKRFILTNEIKARSKNRTLTPLSLSKLEIKPAQDLKVKLGLLYERATIEPLLEVRPWHNSLPVRNPLPTERPSLWNMGEELPEELRLMGYPRPFRGRARVK